MFDRLRLLPTVMLCALLLLGYKVVDLFSGEAGQFPISAAQANETPAKAEAEAQAAQEAAKDNAQAAAEKKDGGHASSVPGEGGMVSTERPKEAQLPDSRMSEAEMAVLGSLSARREELDKRAKELDTRAQLLAAAEKRVEDRIEELKGLEKKISVKLGQVDQQSDQQLVSVVKMYESMKPKDAARIFERLDMGVLVDVARRMNPRNMSAVLAAMDPVTAQELTVELATGGVAGDEADTARAKRPQSEFQGAKAAAQPQPAPEAAATPQAPPA